MATARQARQWGSWDHHTASYLTAAPNPKDTHLRVMMIAVRNGVAGHHHGT